MISKAKRIKPKFKYSVSDKVLDQLVDLFRSWGVKEKDWMLMTSHAMQRHGYRLVSSRDPQELDIAIVGAAVPWKIKKNEWTCVPPQRSTWIKDYQVFMASTGCVVHMMAFPYGPWKESAIRIAPRYALPSKREIKVERPEGVIGSRIIILKDRKWKKGFQERVLRWRYEVELLRRQAREKDDQQLMKVCDTFLLLAETFVHTEVYQAEVSRYILTGKGIGRAKVYGRVRYVRGKSKFGQLRKGEVLVASDTNPDFLPLMKKAKAIVTDRGGLTSHAATLAREFGIPAVIGTRTATKALKTGDRVEVDTKKGTVRKL